MSNRSHRQHATFQSERVAEGWYDGQTMTLELEFEDGTHWLYENVSYDMWEAMKRAGSPGRFVNEFLNSHPNRRA